MTGSIWVRAAMAAVLVAVSSGALAPEGASAQGEATATTVLTQLQRAEMPGGRPGVLGFTAEQDIVGSPEPGSSLGGAVVDPSAEPDFLEGAWARGGELGAWLGAPTDAPARQFDPEVISVEGLRFRNEVTEEGPAPAPGDHLEVGMGLVPFDAPLTWSRARGATGGSLRWETTSVIQTTTSSFGGESGELDVIMFRADIFATGGDVDARREPVTVPSTLIELPRTYRSDAPFLGIAGFASPYTTYIQDFGFTPVLSAGRIEVNATVTGYIPEAKKKILPNGPEINEWHLPITGVIAVSTDRSLVTQAATTMPTGGEVSVVTQSGSQALDVPFAGTASASLVGDSADPETESSGEVSDLTLAVTGGHTLSEDFEAAAALGRDVSSPFPLTSGEGSFTTTVDPDLRGEGFLGLVDPRSRLLKRDFADVLSVPAVEVDGVRHTLTRDKLIGLTALPVRNGGGFRFMPNSANGQDPNVAAALGSRIYKEGVMVDALYDLGDGVIAEVNHQLFHGGVPSGGRANTNVVIRALDGRQLTGGAIGYGETAEVGPAFVNGTRFEEEFTSGGTIEVGRHRIAGTYRTASSIRSGIAGILVAPAPLLGRPVDPSASIFGRRIAALITPPPVAADDAPLTIFHFGQARGIERGPEASLPLGSPCTNVAVTDGSVTDAAPAKDIRAAWFDADLSNLYVSLRLRQVPTLATSPTGDRYTVHWRDDHEGRFAEARIDQVGNWTFRAGLLGSISAPVEGEVRSGTDGVIRIAIPRHFFGYEDGILLRDIGAHSYVGTTTVREDVAPNGSSVEFGLGSDHTIELCPDLPVPTSLDFTALTPVEAIPGSPATLQAALEDSRGIPLAGRGVVFAVGGSTFEATTDELGLATVRPILALAAGSHEVSASFAGDAPYGGSSATTTLVIGKVASSLNLLVEGTGVNRTLTATLHDASTGQPLGSRTIEFFADGLSLGTEQTGPDGRAVMDAPPGFRGAMHDFEARFAGDDGYEPSSAGGTASKP